MALAPSTSAQEPKTLLLVEDEGVIALATGRRLEAKGYRVLTLGSGEEALALCRSRLGIDLILMDVDLGPGMDGAETAQRILAELEIPIVFLSSHADPETVERTEGISSYGYVVKSSTIAVLDASIKMAFRLFEANRRVRLSNSKLEATLDALPDLVFEMGLDGSYFAIHAPDPTLLYRPAEERLGRNIRDYLPPETVEIVLSALAEANEKGYSASRQYELDLASGRRSFELFASRMEGHYEQPHFIYLCRDITERRRLEAELAVAREVVDRNASNFRILTDNLPLFISYFNADTLAYEYVNEAFVSQFSRSREEILRMTLPQLLGEENARFAQPYIDEARRGKSVSYMNRFSLKQGMRWVRVTYVPVLGTAGKISSILVFSFDLTDQKEAEESVRALLEEKELILKEVNHRIKNNMSIIASLLSLQAQQQREEGAVAALKDAVGRVQSMMLLYDKLYISDSFLSLSARTYLGALVDDIAVNFSSSPRIEVEKDIEDFVLDAKLLQPVGIILNELLTNVMKYAFAGRKAGRVRVGASLSGSRMRLEVQDDGLGMPLSVSLAQPSGFGLMMVGVLAKQLGGEVEIVREGGTRVILELPV